MTTLTEQQAEDLYLGRGTRSLEDFTATPWKHTGTGGLIKSAHGECIAIVTDPPRGLGLNLWGHGTYRERVSEQIVRAVNADSQLRAALKAVLACETRHDERGHAYLAVPARSLHDLGAQIAALLQHTEEPPR